MSILRMASFNASYALFLKLVSGAIRTIAISASAMGGALVCFRKGTTDLLKGDSIRHTNDRIFLAYQMPECQGAAIFGISMRLLALTLSFLAYQMPCDGIHPDGDARQGRGASPATDGAKRACASEN